MEYSNACINLLYNIDIKSPNASSTPLTKSCYELTIPRDNFQAKKNEMERCSAYPLLTISAKPKLLKQIASPDDLIDRSCTNNNSCHIDKSICVIESSIAPLMVIVIDQSR